MIIRSLIFALSALMTVSCGSGPENRGSRATTAKEEMADLNRYLIQKDRERIENYIERKDLKMTESTSGFWYLIKSEGKGNYFTDNDKIIMEYECSLLDGTSCYSSKDLGPKEIILGRTEIEPGLSKALRMLKPGAEAIFILPPFLAYGLKGDGEKIPSRAIIIYNINILSN